MTQKPSYLNFNHKKYKWTRDIDYRQNPEKYFVGKGEQGVLICEPFKSEILPYWRFKTPDLAEKSSEKIFELFLEYLKKEEFVGADMARKFLQMGYTRARRYANYKGGTKYDKEHNYKLLEKGTGEKQKAISAEIFFKKWREAESNETYTSQKNQWKNSIG